MAIAVTVPRRNTRSMTHDQATTVSQFLESHRVLSEAGKIDEIEKLDETLQDIAATEPDSALAIIQALSVSPDFTAREAAAVFVQYLFPAQREQVAALLVTLLNDPNPDIARQALTTIDELTGDPHLNANQAAHRITQITKHKH
jgi:hypothetical protein